MIVQSILDTVGKTPMVDVSDTFKTKARLLVKVESFNPGGSVKDRIAKAMIENAMADNTINKDTHIIEPTSGNTGIGLAMVCAAHQLKCTLVMPDTMTKERIKLMKAYGANVVLSPGVNGMKGAIEIANQLASEQENSFIPMQFENKNNPLIHVQTTAIEIVEDTHEHVDVFVAGSGTGGTLSGVGSVLKSIIPHVKIVAVEPETSPIISKNIAGKHGIYGIGPGFIPKNLHVDILDDVQLVSDQQAIDHTRMLAKKCGILVGVSSGAAFKVALDYANKKEYLNKTIVVVLPDTGERYLSTKIFEEDE